MVGGGGEGEREIKGRNGGKGSAMDLNLSRGHLNTNVTTRETISKRHSSHQVSSLQSV